MPTLVRGALAPRLVIQAARSGASDTWVQCVVLLGTMLLVVLVAIQGCRLGHAQFNRPSQASYVPTNQHAPDVESGLLADDRAAV